MALRYAGKVKITIVYDSDRSQYVGSVSTDKTRWKFTLPEPTVSLLPLRPNARNSNQKDAYDGPNTYTMMARIAMRFAVTPDGKNPLKVVAEEIEQAAASALLEEGTVNYRITMKKGY